MLGNVCDEELKYRNCPNLGEKYIKRQAQAAIGGDPWHFFGQEQYFCDMHMKLLKITHHLIA